MPETDKTTTCRETFRQVDRLFLFVFGLICSNVLFCAQSFEQFNPFGMSNAWPWKGYPVLLALVAHLGIATWITFSLWRTKRLYFVLATVGVVDWLTYQYLALETHDSFWFGGLDSRSELFLWILASAGIVFLATQTLVPFLAWLVTKAETRLIKKSPTFEKSRPKQLLILALTFFLYYALVVQDILAKLGIEFLLLSDSSKVGQAPVWLLLVPTLAIGFVLTRRLCNSTWTFLIYSMLYWAFLIWNVCNKYGEILIAGTVAITMASLLLLLAMFWLGIRGYQPNQITPRYMKTPRNWFTRASWTMTAVTVILFPFFVNIDTLHRVNGFGRWECAWNSSLAMKVWRPDFTMTIESLDGVSRVTVEKQITKNDGLDCLQNIPRLSNILILKNVREDINFEFLEECRRDSIVFDEGDLAIDQLNALTFSSGQDSLDIATGHPPIEMRNIRLILPSTPNMFGSLYLDAASLRYDKHDALTKTLETFATLAKLSKNVLVSFGADRWRRSHLRFELEQPLREIDKRHIATAFSNLRFTDHNIQFDFSPENIPQHRAAFKNLVDLLPGSTADSMYVTLALDPSDRNLFSPDQLNFIAATKYQILLYQPPWSVDGKRNARQPSKTQFTAIMDLAWAPLKPRWNNSLPGKSLKKYLLADAQSAFRDYNLVAMVPDGPIGRTTQSLVLPEYDSELVAVAAERFPNIENVSLAPDLLTAIEQEASSDNFQQLKQLSNLKKLYVNQFCGTLDFMADLKHLEEAYFGVRPGHLNWNGELKRLKRLTLTTNFFSANDTDNSRNFYGHPAIATPTIDHTDQTLGFNISQCPNLEIVEIFGRPPIGLIQEFAKAKNIRSISIHIDVKNYDSQSTSVARLYQQTGDIVRILPPEDAPPPPQFFQNHHDAVRSSVLRKYSSGEQ